jgi:16S rRNA methyltransferase RsmB/F
MAVDALDVAEGQTVLGDVAAAAPRGKTTFIVQKMKNTGAIIALEPNGKRARSMPFNIARCSVYNTCIFRVDGLQAGKLQSAYVDESRIEEAHSHIPAVCGTTSTEGWPLCCGSTSFLILLATFLPLLPSF